MNNKNSILEKLIKDEKENLEWYKNCADKASEDYIGTKLTSEVRRYENYIEEAQVKIEAYELLLKSL